MISSSYNQSHNNWKPILPNGTTSTHIRPFTNKDYTNTYSGPFGKPRPLKQYRKGVIPYPDTNNRMVQSSVSQPLNGGLGLLSQVQDVPGSYQVSDNTCNGKCNGEQIVHAYYPEEGSLTDNPQPLITVTREFCCNRETKALKRVIYANQTGYDDSYHQDYKGYLDNRCKSFYKHDFNFVGKSPEQANAYVMVGPPYSTTRRNLGSYRPSSSSSTSDVMMASPSSDSYVTDSQSYVGSNGSRPNLAVYKPNNFAYAMQGPTSSSTRISKLKSISRDCNYRLAAPIKQENILRKATSAIHRCKSLITAFGDAMGKC